MGADKQGREKRTMGASVLKTINHLFPKQQHPFNMQNDGTKTYAQWQYEKGQNTIAFYLEKYTTDEMFRGKTVLDMGCGAAGKSLYYASLGAKKVVGVDIVASYRQEAEQLAEQLGYADVFEFVLGDVTKLDLPEGSFDTIIMNDFMEHASDPEGVLHKAFQLLREGGRIYVNFPPYNHPFGAHLSDAINMPWVHVFFSDKTLIQVYKDLTASLPDGAERVKFRISKDANGEEYFSYINKMTIKRFGQILKRLNITPEYYREAPLRGFLKPFANTPLKEYVIKMVVCVIEKKPGQGN